MSYFPAIANARPRMRYTFGEYKALLLDGVRSAQAMQYHYVLMVFRDQEPCLAVASEYCEKATRENPFLGVFPGEGHVNLGQSAEWLDIDAFARRALHIVQEQLGIDPGCPLFVEHARPKPWWRFW